MASKPKLHAQFIAPYHPADEAAHAFAGEIAACQWKAQRNNQMEAAIFSRELLRQAESFAADASPNSLELALAAQEALTGNKTIAQDRYARQAT